MRLPEWDDPDRRDAALARMAVRLQAADPLTRRELAVIFLLSHGLTIRKAREMLEVSEHTAKEHAKHARLKLAATTNAHAVAIALRTGLFS